MGACGSTNRSKESQQIDKRLKTDFESNKGHKILLLGPGDSGKSTFLKQLVELYAEDKTSSKPELYTDTIHANTIDCIQTLIRQSKKLSYEFPECSVGEEAQTAVELLENLDRECKIDAKIGGAIRTAWHDPGIRETYKHRDSFQLLDNVVHFLDRATVLGKPSYSPTRNDIIRCRLRTLGITEIKLTVEDSNFTIVDVGGQRSERHKWIHCFDECVAVVFFVSSSSYDQTLLEDDETNCMDEAVALFDQVFNSRWFAKSSFLLFLNKSDILKEKLERVPLSSRFSDYVGSDHDSARKFLTKQFEAKCRYGKNLTTHFTCMTDDNSIEAVFSEVMKMMLRKDLEEDIFA